MMRTHASSKDFRSTPVACSQGSLLQVLPVVISVGIVVAVVAGLRALRKAKDPPLAVTDAPWFLLGVAVMVASDIAQSAPASAWSYVVDCGSFAVGATLIGTTKPKNWFFPNKRTERAAMEERMRTWPRNVGLLILGIHFAQVFFTNEGAPLSTAGLSFDGLWDALFHAGP